MTSAVLDALSPASDRTALVDALPASADRIDSPRPRPVAAAGTRVVARGCPVSTGSQAAIDHVEKGLWRAATYFGNALDDYDAAIAADPRWLLPHVLKANVMLGATEAPYAAMAVATLEQAEALVDGANERERRHLAASRLCAADRWAEACAAWEGITLDHPRDFAAINAAHVFDFFRGDARNLQRRLTRVLPEWSSDAPLYAQVLGMHAFGLEEMNLYEQALETGLAALAIDRADPWSVHAVAHVHEMRGRHDDGAAFLRGRADDWAPGNGFAYHNWWHLALFELEACRFDAALDLLDRHVLPATETALSRIDATAMLWRLRLHGVDLGARWTALADAWPIDAPAAGFYAFNDLHAALAQIGAGRIDDAERLLGHVVRTARASTATGVAARDAGVPLLLGVLAHARGRHADAVDALWRARDASHRFGGSHAQRDLVTLTLIDAAVRAGERTLARRLLNERRIFKRDTPLTARLARTIG